VGDLGSASQRETGIGYVASWNRADALQDARDAGSGDVLADFAVGVERIALRAVERHGRDGRLERRRFRDERTAQLQIVRVDALLEEAHRLAVACNEDANCLFHSSSSFRGSNRFMRFPSRSMVSKNILEGRTHKSPSP